MILAPYIAAAHLESAAMLLDRAADELRWADPDAAVEFTNQATDFRQRAAELEAAARVFDAIDEAEAAAYDEAHPV